MRIIALLIMAVFIVIVDGYMRGQNGDELEQLVRLTHGASLTAHHRDHTLWNATYPQMMPIDKGDFVYAH